MFPISIPPEYSILPPLMYIKFTLRFFFFLISFTSFLHIPSIYIPTLSFRFITLSHWIPNLHVWLFVWFNIFTDPTLANTQFWPLPYPRLLLCCPGSTMDEHGLSVIFKTFYIDLRSSSFCTVLFIRKRPESSNFLWSQYRGSLIQRLPLSHDG